MVPFLTFFVEELGVQDEDARNRWAGLLVGAAPLCAALMGPVWGSIGDHFGRKAMVVRALMAIVVFVGLMWFVESLWVMLLLRALQGCFSGYVPPSLTLVTLQAPPDRQSFVAGWMQAAVPAGAVAGFLIGGFINDVGEARWIFPICSALALVSVLIVMMFVDEGSARLAPSDGHSPRAVFTQLVSDYRYVFRLPTLVRFLLAIVFIRALVSMVDPNFAHFVASLGGSGFEAGLVFSAEKLMLILFMPFWGKRSDLIGHRRTFSLCAVGVAIGFFGQAAAGGVAVLTGWRVFTGIFLAGVFPAAYGLAARESDEDHRGAAMGVVFLCLALSHAGGALVGGEALNAFGFRTLMRAISVVCLGFAVLGLLEVLRSRTRASTETSA